MKVLPRSISTIKFLTIQNRSFSCEVSVCRKKGIVPSNAIGFLIALRNTAVERLFTLYFHSSRISLRLVVLSPAPVLRRQVFGLSFLGVVVHLNIYIIRRFEKNATISDVARKTHSLTNNPSKSILCVAAIDLRSVRAK